MTERQLYAIIDSKAEDIIGTVILARANAIAVRIFTDLIKSDENDVGRHPEDFTLVQLGILKEDLTLEPARKDIITGTTVRELLEGALRAQEARQ